MLLKEVALLKKTQLLKLSNGFTFLKARYFLTESGKVATKPCRDSIARMRRKLKGFKGLMDAGKMTLDDIRISYRSWRGYISHTDCFKTVQSMNNLFIDLFKSFP